MITKIELKEILNSVYLSQITIDLINNNIIYIKDDTTIKNESITIDIEQLTDLTKKHITFWDDKYIDNTIIDGKTTELIIYTNNETIKYLFKNKYPYNYNEFISSLKTMVNII